MTATAAPRVSIQRDVLARGLGGAVLRALLPGLVVRRSGWTPCRCPNTRAHKDEDANPSASVSPDAGHLVCHSAGCGVKLDLVQLAVIVGRAPDDATAARWIRATFLDGPPPAVSSPPAAADDDRERIIRARSIYHRAGLDGRQWADIPADDERARLLRDYVPPWPVVALDELAVRFLPAVPERDFPPRLVFPIRDLDGRLVAVKLRAAVRGVEPKSLSIGPASRGLIGRDQLTRKPSALVILAAGEKDATHGAALLPSLAWVSSAIGEGNALDGLVAAFVGRDVAILADADRPGASGAEERRAELAPVARSVRVVTWPASALVGGGKDLADVVATFGPERAARGLARLLGRADGAVTR